MGFTHSTPYEALTLLRCALRPPAESKHKEVPYLDIPEGDEVDEAQMATWIRQAAVLPGWGGQP